MGEAKKGRQGNGRRRRSKKALLVGRVIKKIEQKLKDDELKPTVGDLVRLLQVEKELEEEEARPEEIRISWVEKREEERATEK